MLYFIGLGLGDVKDITVKGLEIVRKCERVYLEAYTSVLTYGGKTALEEFYGRYDLVEADRDLVESGADTILMNADSVDVAFLVVGDPFGATTHTDLLLRAKGKNQVYINRVIDGMEFYSHNCCSICFRLRGSITLKKRNINNVITEFI